MQTNKWIIEIIKALLVPLETSGEHRKEQWEKGWKQNLDENSIIPHYFGKYPVVRKNWVFIEAPEGFEYEQLAKLENKVFTKYLKHAQSIVEVGCGTGHNLVRVRKINPHALITGVDWAESAVDSVRKLGFKGATFDMFNPRHPFNGDSIFTVAALEQTGDKFHKFIDYLIEQEPEICVHLEPIEELMDKNNLLDFLQLEYMKKRRYLTGFLTYLRELEQNGKIEILEASRNGIGSLFIEGYSLVVWKPKS